MIVRAESKEPDPDPDPFKNNNGGLINLLSPVPGFDAPLFSSKPELLPFSPPKVIINVVRYLMYVCTVR